MQPENQSGAPVPQVPPAPQPTPLPPVQPVQSPVQQPVPVPQPQQQFAAAPVPNPAPVTQPPQPPQPAVAPVQPAPPQQQPAPFEPSDPTVAPDVLGGVAVADQVDSGYAYAGEDDQDEEGDIDLSQPVSWQAKEYIHQEKDMKWFAIFAVVIAIFLAVAIFLMKSWSFVLVLIAIAGVIIFFSKRPPRVMEYALSEEGLHIDNTLHKYTDYKSFGVIRDGEEYSIMLVPRRRFYPGITVYFPEEAGEDIVDVLGSRMPMRDLHLDAIDKLVRKLRL